MASNEYNHIWLAFLSGDKTALSELFLTYYDDLYRYGYKLTGIKEMVEDSIQDLFLKLWKNRSSIKPVDNPKAYLYKSLRHHIIDSVQLVRPCMVLNDKNDDCLNIKYTQEDFLIDSQVTESIRQKVINALNQLPPRQREVIYLRYFEEVDFETIARIINIRVQSVRNTIHRGMVAMRDLMLLQPFLFLIGRSLSIA